MAQQARLSALEGRLTLALRARCRLARERTEQLETRLRRALDMTVQARQWRLQSLATRLESANPRVVLKRGYAWVARPDGRPVTRADALSPGDRMDAVFENGQVSATVNAVQLNPSDP